MDLDMYFQKVEEVLNDYPIEWQKNYYRNKKTLLINREKNIMNGIYGSYQNVDNLITLYKEESLVHELFHMSFRDEDKTGKKIFDEKNYYYSNGVAILNYNNNEVIGKGINEGFTEYLSRKCCDICAQDFNYYFADLLISIHGEEILKYPFMNDPRGLYMDKRFTYINQIIKVLDGIEECKSIILLFSRNYNDIYKIMNDDINDCNEILETINDTNIVYNESLILLFDLIINEYNSCDDPLIEKEEFINKLENFLIDKNYEVAFKMYNKKINVKKEIKKIINKFKKKNTNFIKCKKKQKVNRFFQYN